MITLKKYRFAILFGFLSLILTFFIPLTDVKPLMVSANSAKEMLMVLPPIFVLLGILDIWVSRETMIRYMGEESGFKGILFAFVLGTAAAGPLYAAFPIAGILLKKGAKFSNILVFIGTWSTAKIPMLLMEASYLGTKFMVIRFVLSMLGICLITVITEKALNQKDRELIYQKATSRD